MGYVIGLIVGYFLNKTWTYKKQADVTHKDVFFKYLIVYTFSLVLSTIFLKFIVDDIALFNAQIGNIFAICISTILNFLGTNFFVFNNKKKKESGQYNAS